MKRYLALIALAVGLAGCQYGENPEFIVHNAQRTDVISALTTIGNHNGYSIIDNSGTKLKAQSADAAVLIIYDIQMIGPSDVSITAYPEIIGTTTLDRAMVAENIQSLLSKELQPTILAEQTPSSPKDIAAKTTPAVIIYPNDPLSPAAPVIKKPAKAKRLIDRYAPLQETP